LHGHESLPAVAETITLAEVLTFFRISFNGDWWRKLISLFNQVCRVP
jgi:hypothetical protein